MHCCCDWTVSTVRLATTEDIDALVNLQQQLFAEDALTHDTFVDPDWPARQGYADFTNLLASASCLVLVATPDALDRSGRDLIGYVVGYTSRPMPPTKAPSASTGASGSPPVASRGSGRSRSRSRPHHQGLCVVGRLFPKDAQTSNG